MALTRCGQGYGDTILTGSGMAVERDVEICPLCGSLEAVRDALGLPPIPPDEWPVDPDEPGREFAAHIKFLQCADWGVVDLCSRATGHVNLRRGRRPRVPFAVLSAA